MHRARSGATRLGPGLTVRHTHGTELATAGIDLPAPRGRATLADPQFVDLKARVLARVLDA